MNFLNNFKGLVIFIDSGICLKKEELGLLKIVNHSVDSLSQLRWSNYNLLARKENVISLILNCATASGSFLNEAKKTIMAKNVANLVQELVFS